MTKYKVLFNRAYIKDLKKIPVRSQERIRGLSEKGRLFELWQIFSVILIVFLLIDSAEAIYIDEKALKFQENLTQISKPSFSRQAH